MTAVQVSFDELGTPLREVVFVVVDLETTGGSPAAGHGITEIGAVKVRGGEVLGELRTFVDPGTPIPPLISVLTGITDADVVGAPTVAAVLPTFLEFARGAVLVAHNAGFDTGFLRAAAAAHGTPWPSFAVLDTVVLARAVLARGEVRNHKLATLAAHLGASTTPNHRALSDARATVDVLHALLERVGPLGVQSLEDLQEFTRHRVDEQQRRKRRIAEDVPDAPGVYVFKDDGGSVLYVGRSRSMRRRVRTYFTASERRSRMAEMVRRAVGITPVVCATSLEAEVREIRLIAEHKPPFNRRSRNPEGVWLKLTVEPFPRLSVVRTVRDEPTLYFGPFRSRARALVVAEVLHDAIPLRQCAPRLDPRRRTSACVLADLGRCGAPCAGGEDVDAYAVHVAAVHAALTGDPEVVLERARHQLERLAAEERFEEAAARRDRTDAFLRATDRWQRACALTRVTELVAARRTPEGGWDLAVVRHGRLAGSAHAPPGRPPRPVVDALVATAETVVPGAGPLPASSAEEVATLLRWLDSPGVRLVAIDGDWTCPARSAASRLVA